MCRTSSSSLLLLFLDVSMADGDGALDVFVPLFPLTSFDLVDGCLLVSLIEVLFMLMVVCCSIVYLIVGVCCCA